MKKILSIVIIGTLYAAGITTGVILENTTNETSKNNTQESYDLLIIAPEKFSDALQHLIDHKKSVGIQTLLETTENIYNAYDARDKAEEIKLFIRDSIEKWDINYVLLVGGKTGQIDDWYLPVRYVQMNNGWESGYISDLYFADIYDNNGDFSSWDKDNDGLYGEWIAGNAPEDVGIDLYPDISIGRLACRTVSEVITSVQKIIDYETNTSKKSWFNNMVVIAGDTFLESENPLWVGYEGEEYANLALEHMNQFNPIRLFISDGSLKDSQDVINAYNNGCGFIYFVGHGNPMSWGNHPPNDPKMVLGLMNHEMNKLKNKDKYPVCIISGCHNCQFDVGFSNILHGILEEGLKYFLSLGGGFWKFKWTPECWGWRMTNKMDGGSILTYGSTALIITQQDKSSFKGGVNELEVEIFHQYGGLGVQYAGDIMKNAISWYLDNYPVYWTSLNNILLFDTWVDVQIPQSYILLGDPSLKIGGYP